MNKIIIRIAGGVGNQMFMYAAARHLSSLYGAELVIDAHNGYSKDEYGRSYELDKFSISGRYATDNELLQPFPRLRKKTLIFFRGLFSSLGIQYISQKNMDYHEIPVRGDVGGVVYLDGYWQSENYFISSSDLIRQDFQLKSSYIDASRESLVSDVKKTCSVAVHLRFFDENGVWGGNNASISYYLNAIDYVVNKLENCFFYIFSDDVNRAKLELGERDNFFFIMPIFSHSAVNDLWLMSHCKHFIIANSTFSWWGAWLSANDHKIVIAPKMQSPSWNIRGRLPDSWIEM